MSPHDFIKSRAQMAATNAAQGHINRALNGIQNIVEAIITNPSNTGIICSSDALDRLCMQIGENVFASLPRPTIVSDEIPTFVYIATRLQRSGGHTRLLRDFVYARPEARHVILLTERAGRSDHDWINETFKDMPHYYCLTAPRGNALNALRWLQTELLVIAPIHTYLFNHHQDAVAASALVPSMGLPASFAHHGDHHLCLGVHFMHVTHLDFNPTCYHYCHDILGLKNRYMPFTVPARNPVHSAQFLTSGHLTTATAAGSNKLEQPYFVSYADVIPEILKRTGGTHIHIGRLSASARGRILRGMRKLNIQPECFAYIPWVPSVWEMLVEKHVDVFLSSFPYTGALTLIEAMGAGIPLMLHRHASNRLLSGIDLSYENAMSWGDPEELYRKLVALNPETLFYHSVAGRSHYERYYQTSWKSKLHPDASLVLAPDLKENYQPAVGHRAHSIVEVFSRILQRTAYRFYRKLRAYGLPGLR